MTLKYTSLSFSVIATLTLSACQSSNSVDTTFVIPASNAQQLPSGTIDLGLIERIGTTTLSTPLSPQQYSKTDASRAFSDMGFKTQLNDEGFTVFLTNSDNAHFDHNKAELKPELAKQLKKIAIEANKPYLADHFIKVAGHTDMVGSDNTNQELSEVRARNVSQTIVALGIHEPRLSSIGYGENNPLYFAPSKTQLNRRTDLLFIAP